MKIITWNVNGLRAVSQKGFHEFWERENPDILCLQETKVHPDQLTESLRAPPGWHSFWSAANRPGYSGTAVFSRQAPERVTYGIDIPKFDAEGRIVCARFEAFTLYNVYFPNGGSGPERHQYKQEFLKRFHYHLNKKLKAHESVIVVGDYNVAPLAIDVYDPKALDQESGFLPEERAWMAEFLKSGFIDSFRHFHPTAPHRYSWWSYQQNGRAVNRGWRIDHICVSRNLEKNLKSCEILEDQMGSDHCPVRLELNP